MKLSGITRGRSAAARPAAAREPGQTSAQPRPAVVAAATPRLSATVRVARPGRKPRPVGPAHAAAAPATPAATAAAAAAENTDIDELADFKPQAQSRRTFMLYLLAFFGAAALLGASAYLAFQRTFAGPELRIFHVINNWPDKLRTFFRIITLTPDSTWIGAAAVVIVFLFKKYRLAWRLAVSVIGGFVLAELGKHFVARPRPAAFISDLHLRMHETDMGFPSGHTMIVTVIMLTLFPYIRHGWRWLLFIPIVLMALSRIYLGVHAPLDVVGGFAIGVLVVSFIRILPLKLSQFFRLK